MTCCTYCVLDMIIECFVFDDKAKKKDKIDTFNENFLPHISNKSSKLGPRSSITSALYFPQGPK